jgi:hypothetical protein
MRILLEICLTVCESFQEWNIQRSARRAARISERKTIFTFLSQAAVGGVFALFVQIFYSVIANPTGYNGFLLGLFPFFAALYAMAGAVAGVFIWLLEARIRSLRFAAKDGPSETRAGSGVAFLSLTLRFIVRTITAMVVMPSLLFAFFYFVSKRELSQMSNPYWIGFSSTTGLLIGLITGSSIRTCRAIIFGVAGRKARRNFGTGLSNTFGALLRLLSVFALFESLLTLALWISNVRVDQDWFPVREQLPEVVCAIIYFAISSYLSFRTPDKFSLLPIATVLNVPLVVWIAEQLNVGTANSEFFAYSLLAFVCLWTIYTLGCLIAPEPPLRTTNSLTEPRARGVTPGAQFRVHV